jgi:hypothetical protein
MLLLYIAVNGTIGVYPQNFAEALGKLAIAIKILPKKFKTHILGALHRRNKQKFVLTNTQNGQ